MKIIILTLLTLLFSRFAIAAPIVVPVGPASDVDCQFNTVQAAVDSGIINMDIRMSNQVIIDTGIVIVDKDIAYLRGGYANCQDAIDNVIDVNNPWTTISNGVGNGIDIVYSIDNFHTLNLQRLRVFNNEIGISVVKNGFNHTLIVHIDKTDIVSNKSTGLYFNSNTVGLEVSFDDGKISNNNTMELADFGGGINCIGGAIEINIGEFVSIDHNFAQSGGGISVFECNVYISAGDNNPIGLLQYGIFENTALLNGAGVYVSFRGNFIAIGTEFHPVSISNNALIIRNGARTSGGGIYIGSDSIAQLINARIDNNTSLHKGGGITLLKHGVMDTAPQMTIEALPEGCVYAEICNSISNNSLHFSIAGYGGAAVYVGDGAILTVAQTVFDGNSAGSQSVFKVSGSSQLNLISDLIINNANDVDLFDQEDLSSVIVHYSTLADNQVNNYFNVQYDNNNAQVLEVKGSIIKNGLATIANLNNDMGNHDAQVACSLVENNDASGVVQNGTIIGNPGFIDTTNFKLRRDSIALNASCFPVGEFDIARYDILGVDRFGSGQADMGAYEMGYLFQDGFE